MFIKETSVLLKNLKKEYAKPNDILIHDNQKAINGVRLNQAELKLLKLQVYSLYITSNDEIKNGDSFISFENIHICDKNIIGFDPYHANKIGKKVIASNDSLPIYHINPNGTIDKNKIVDYLPYIYDDFMQSYLQEFNKKTKVDNLIRRVQDVFVEYEENIALDGHTILGIKPKTFEINGFTFISMKPIKNDYLKGEVEAILREFAQSVDMEYRKFTTSNTIAWDKLYGYDGYKAFIEKI